MVGREPTLEEKINIVIEFIEKNGTPNDEGQKTVGYKKLQDHCADLFEGVRLLLKTMKNEGYVDYDGMIPGFSSVITLLKSKEELFS